MCNATTTMNIPTATAATATATTTASATAIVTVANPVSNHNSRSSSFRIDVQLSR